MAVDREDEEHAGIRDRAGRRAVVPGDQDPSAQVAQAEGIVGWQIVAGSGRADQRGVRRLYLGVSSRESIVW